MFLHIIKYLLIIEVCAFCNILRYISLDLYLKNFSSIHIYLLKFSFIRIFGLFCKNWLNIINRGVRLPEFSGTRPETSVFFFGSGRVGPRLYPKASKVRRYSFESKISLALRFYEYFCFENFSFKLKKEEK